MLLSMLVFMLYRRERYTSGYSFLGWPAAANDSSVTMSGLMLGNPGR